MIVEDKIQMMADKYGIPNDAMREIYEDVDAMRNDDRQQILHLNEVVKKLQDNAYEASQTIEEAKELLNHFVFGDNKRHEAIKWIQEVEKKIMGE